MRYFVKVSLISLMLMGLAIVLGMFFGEPLSEAAGLLTAKPNDMPRDFLREIMVGYGFSAVLSGVALLLRELDPKHRSARATAEVTEVGEQSVYSEGEHIDCMVVTCRHQVQDTWHTGSFQAGVSTNIGFISQWQQKLYGPGTKVGIRYDPNNPDDLVLPKGWLSLSSLILVALTGTGLALFFLAAGTLGRL